MTRQPLPEAALAPSLKREIDVLAASFDCVEDAESVALFSDIAAPLQTFEPWIEFREMVENSITVSGYVVVRGLEADEGRSLLIVSRALGPAFEAYRPGRVVKRFRMSPWTDELSHTMRRGDFHTDGNVSSSPPLATAIQCEVEDPGAPRYAEQRVAHLPALLGRLAAGDLDDATALEFLTRTDAVLAHERSQTVWRGPLVERETIRYHPHSLRVGALRTGLDSAKVETVIAAVHRAALDVSVPFHTRPGDTVLVSNRTALHYRGECSVRFTRFPTEFEARSVFVLHLKEPSA